MHSDGLKVLLKNKESGDYLYATAPSTSNPNGVVTTDSDEASMFTFEYSDNYDVKAMILSHDSVNYVICADITSSKSAKSAESAKENLTMKELPNSPIDVDNLDEECQIYDGEAFS